MKEGKDYNTYLTGVQSIVQAPNSRLVPGSLSAAAFWVALRMDIYSAVTNHRAMTISLDHDHIDQSFNPADDHTWANRAVVHCAEVLNFCFGDDNRWGRWEQLYRWNQQWEKSLPLTCRPIFYQGDTGAPFPEIWYHSGCHGRLGDSCLARSARGG
jgi:hypothetical protein